MEKEWKQVFLTGEMYQAEMASAMLDDAGINSVVMDQHDSSYPMIGNIEVYVHESDELRALEILKELKI